MITLIKAIWLISSITKILPLFFLLNTSFINNIAQKYILEMVEIFVFYITLKFFKPNINLKKKLIWLINEKILNFNKK